MKIFLFILNLICCFHLFSQNTTAIETEIFNEINSYREEIGESKFAYVSDMVASCRDHSKYMGTNNLLEHVKSLSQVDARAEIIQMNYTDGRTNNEIAIDVLEVFIDSPGHKKIIEGTYNQISVGVYVTSDEDLWVTIRFN